MILHSRPGIFALTMFLASLVAPPLVAQQGGWKSSADRYGSVAEPVGAASRAASTPSRLDGATDMTPIQDGGALAPVNPGTTRAAVSKGSGTLPNDQGQVWREYDIRPYTVRVTTTARPEQAIV